jgi:hypothetical protein
MRSHYRRTSGRVHDVLDAAASAMQTKIMEPEMANIAVSREPPIVRAPTAIEASEIARRRASLLG